MAYSLVLAKPLYLSFRSFPDQMIVFYTLVKLNLTLLSLKIIWAS